MNAYVRKALITLSIFSAGWIGHIIYSELNIEKSILLNEHADVSQANQSQNVDDEETSLAPFAIGADRGKSPILAENNHASTTAPPSHRQSAIGQKPLENNNTVLNLDEVWMSNDLSAWKKTSKKVLQSVEALIAEGNLLKARELIDNLLRLDEKNIEALKLSALIFRDQGQNLLSLNEIYKAKFAASGGEREQAISQDAHQWLAELAAKSLSERDEIALLDLYLKAVELEPDYGRYYINLAQRYLDLGNTQDAINTLETARFDSSIAVEIDNMLAAIHNQKPVDFSNAYKIPLARVGHQYYAQVRLNGEYESTWLLDTGASVSAITPDAFNRLLVNNAEEGQAWFNTANGMVRAKTVVINSLDIATIHIESLKVGVLDLASGGHFDGLLGMDFLRQFNFYLDQSNNILYLRTP